MSKAKIIFKKELEDINGVEVKTANKMLLYEEEAHFPEATLFLHKSEFDLIKDCEYCDIYRYGELFFKGKLIMMGVQGDVMEVRLTTDLYDDYLARDEDESVAILKKFKEENPDLFTKTISKETTRTGEKVESNIQKPTEPPIDIDNEVVAGTLKVEEAADMPLSEVNVSLKAAWISRIEGAVNLSTKIENRFKMARINTITSKKLEDSWPEFGDRIRSHGTTSTKYAIASSRLRETESQFFPEITINDLLPQLKLKKHIYENRLLIGWDYDQYMNEMIDIRIKSDLKSHKGNRKILNINLKNVQEYIEDPGDTSFFRGKNGLLILNAIIKSIGDYMALSWRNIEASFEVLENEKTKFICCNNWIKLRGKNYKITKIEREITNDQSLIKIKARAFGNDLIFKNCIKSIDLPKEEQKVLTPEDIIEDITVHNEAGEQYEKLLHFISENKEKLNKSNYRSAINNFLNANQTVIQIIAKPLKTKHCETKVIDPIEVIWGNGSQDIISC